MSHPSTSVTTDDMDDLELLKIPEVMALWNVGRRTVEELIRSGELRSYKTRGARPVSRKHALEYLKRAQAC